MTLIAPLRQQTCGEGRRLASAVALVLLCVVLMGGLALAEEPSADTKKEPPVSEVPSADSQSREVAAAAKLVIEAGKTVELSCQTSAIGMDFEPFKSTKGKLRVVIEFNAEAGRANSDGTRVAGSKIGVWRASVSDENAHEASLGRITSQLCKAGCLVRSTSSGGLELWAPRPVMPRDLGEDETMTLVSFDMTKLELKATTFRGQQLSILERGTCDVVEAQVPQEGKTP